MSWLEKILRRGRPARDAVPRQIPYRLPVLPLTDTVLFPGGVLSRQVGRTDQISLVMNAVRKQGLLLVAAQRSAESQAQPRPGDMFDVGVVARVTEARVLADGDLTFCVQGLWRCRLTWLLSRGPWLHAELALAPTEQPQFAEREALAEAIRSAARSHLARRAELSAEQRERMTGIRDAEDLSNLVAANLGVSVALKQHVLETSGLQERMEKVLSVLREVARHDGPALRLVPEPEGPASPSSCR